VIRPEESGKLRASLHVQEYCKRKAEAGQQDFRTSVPCLPLGTVSGWTRLCERRGRQVDPTATGSSPTLGIQPQIWFPEMRALGTGTANSMPGPCGQPLTPLQRGAAATSAYRK
jgi:hypothetical protein